MRLVRVELDRFRSRRAIVLMVIAGLLLVVWLAASTLWTTRPVSETALAGAKEQAAEAQGQLDRDYQACVSDPTTLFPEATASDCVRSVADYRHYLARAPLDVDEELRDTGRVAIVLFLVLAVIMGATFAGADWTSGSIGNQLLFRPRRWQVWAGKAVAVTAGVTVAAALALALLWGSFLLAAELRDLGHSPGFFDTLVGQVGRGLALVAAAGLGGYAVTMLLRSTVGTLALLFAYAVGGEALAATFPIEKVTQWTIDNNVWAFLYDGHKVFDETLACPGSGGRCSMTYVLSLEHGAAYLFGLLLVAVVASLVAFHRRDVP